MIVRFTPDANETVRACAALSARDLPPERGQLIVLAMCAVGFVAAYIVVPSHWILVGVFSYVLTMLTFTVIRLDHQRRVAGMLHGNKHLNENHEIELTSARLMSRCSHVASEYYWSAIEQVTENSEFYVFSTGPASGLAVPKRALSDTEEQELRALVRATAPDQGVNLAREIGGALAVP